MLNRILNKYERLYEECRKIIEISNSSTPKTEENHN